MKRDTANQGVYVKAQTVASASGATGEAANITAVLSQDGGATAALGDTNPTEIGGGVYWFDFTQAETDFLRACLIPTCSTSGVEMEPVILSTMFDGNIIEVGGQSAGIDSTYQAQVFVNTSGASDEWVVCWFRDGGTASTVTVPTIAVVDAEDESVVFGATAMDAVFGGNNARYSESVDTVTSGKAYIATVTATIDGATRTAKVVVPAP